MTPSRRFVLVPVVLCALAIGFSAPARADTSGNATVADVTQLESQAVDAYHHGEFDRGSELLGQAATVDPQVKPLAQWAGDFQSLQKTFAAERQKEFEKNVKDVHVLIEHHMPDYAIDVLLQAYLRAPDKAAFRKEKWVDDLVKTAGDDAQKAEADQKWLTTLRIYSDLTGVDPAVPAWKQKIKQVTQRIRLLMLYTPDQFKAVQKAEGQTRKAADDLLHPTTQPAVAAKDENLDDNPHFKLDWHDTVRGATFDMLLDSLNYADRDYYRQVNLKTLVTGGIDGLRILVTTQGLEKTFSGLADPAKKAEFLTALDQATNDANQINPDNQDVVVRNVLASLLESEHDTVNLPDEVFVSQFTDGALDELDPFSSMIWPYDMQEFLQTTQGDFPGVGIQIESADDGSLKVVTPLEDSPAYKAGIKADDIITAIDGKNAHGISLNQAVKNITGPPHSFVDLTVRSPDGTVRNYSIERQVINVVSVKGYAHLPGGGWNYFVDPQSKIAYLRLTNFTAKSGAELTGAMDELKRQGARALILDLRYNPGGLLNAAVTVASQFVRDGVIVSTHPDRDTENRPTVADAEPDDETTDMPLAVLVNQYSASASEIVSGALKDHARATIVGERTFGKGSVQMLFPLANKSAFLKLTTSHYYLPSGRCLHREENSTVWGVDPDVTIEMTPEQMRAAIDARQEMEVLRDAGPTTQPAAKTDLLASDPQLSGALLVLRLRLAGVQI